MASLTLGAGGSPTRAILIVEARRAWISCSSEQMEPFVDSIREAGPKVMPGSCSNTLRERKSWRAVLLSLPDRKIIESGPPEEITKAFDELFTAKIAATKIASAKAREEMGWPARRHL